METDRTIAYFFMEIALEGGMPTYSGGLGMLAGATGAPRPIFTFPMVAVTLLHRQGYFFSSAWMRRAGNTRSQCAWAIHDFVQACRRGPQSPSKGGPCTSAPAYVVRGFGGFTVPVNSLDADLPDNAACDRTLTGTLYGGDAHYRLCQEVLLGIGGSALRALGYTVLSRWHMNRGMPACSPWNCSMSRPSTRGSAGSSRTTTSRSSVSNACLLPIPRFPPVAISFHSTSWNACLAPALRFTPCPKCSVARASST